MGAIGLFLAIFLVRKLLTANTPVFIFVEWIVDNGHKSMVCFKDRYLYQRFFHPVLAVEWNAHSASDAAEVGQFCTKVFHSPLCLGHLRTASFHRPYP